ncbi:MAG TPA: 3-hydroxyacyl-CoA dehydrogenase family protein, partial [Gemmatimonadaceae bacterium]|nr:3-hydroxyacyl-CoA dehydrogenase family protein [Gemmatimonadaceae bacterium]
IVAMLINEAVDAVLLGVASPHDIDLAMTKGVNYPRGLLAWADDLGAGVVLARLEALQAEYGEDRYRPSALLRRRARDGGRFLG